MRVLATEIVSVWLHLSLFLSLGSRRRDPALQYGCSSAALEVSGLWDIAPPVSLGTLLDTVRVLSGSQRV